MPNRRRRTVCKKEDEGQPPVTELPSVGFGLDASLLSAINALSSNIASMNIKLDDVNKNLAVLIDQGRIQQKLIYVRKVHTAMPVTTTIKNDYVRKVPMLLDWIYISVQGGSVVAQGNGVNLRIDGETVSIPFSPAFANILSNFGLVGSSPLGITAIWDDAQYFYTGVVNLRNQFATSLEVDVINYDPTYTATISYILLIKEFVKYDLKQVKDFSFK